MAAIIAAAAISAIGGLFGASKQRKAAKRAQSTARAEQQAATAKALAELEALKPYEETGRGALQRLRMLSGEGGDAEGYLRSLPGYDFRYGEGKRATESRQSAAGNVLSGAALKELTRYGQGFASNEFGNEFNRQFQLAQFGLQGPTQRANIQAGLGNTLSNLAQQGGQSQTDYYSSLNNALQSGLQNYTYMQGRRDYLDYLKNLQPNKTSPESSYGP